MEFITITELIKKLSNIEKEHGDLPVSIGDSESPNALVPAQSVITIRIKSNDDGESQKLVFITNAAFDDPD